MTAYLKVIPEMCHIYWLSCLVVTVSYILTILFSCDCHVYWLSCLDLLMFMLPQTFILFVSLIFWLWVYLMKRGRRGRDHMVVGFTTTYAISAYNHWCTTIYDKVCQWLATGRWFSLVFQFPPPIKLTGYNWNIVESGVNHHQTNTHIFWINQINWVKARGHPVVGKEMLK